jgi:hypothetical protein
MTWHDTRSFGLRAHRTLASQEILSKNERGENSLHSWRAAKNQISNHSGSSITDQMYHLFLAITSTDSKHRRSHHESGWLDGELMAVHPATLPSTNGAKREGEGGGNVSVPNFEWAPCEVSAGVQKDCNVLTNKIRIPPSKPEWVTLMTLPRANPTHKMANSAQNLNKGLKHNAVTALHEPTDAR